MVALQWVVVAHVWMCSDRDGGFRRAHGPGTINRGPL